jgi:predicted nucleic acid-binding protein
MIYFSQELTALVVLKSQVIAYELVLVLGRESSSKRDSLQAISDKITIQIEYLNDFCDLLEKKVSKSMQFCTELTEISEKSLENTRKLAKKINNIL